MFVLTQKENIRLMSLTQVQPKTARIPYCTLVVGCRAVTALRVSVCLYTVQFLTELITHHSLHCLLYPLLSLYVHEERLDYITTAAAGREMLQKGREMGVTINPIKQMVFTK